MSASHQGFQPFFSVYVSFHSPIVTKPKGQRVLLTLRTHFSPPLIFIAYEVLNYFTRRLSFTNTLVAAGLFPCSSFIFSFLLQAVGRWCYNANDSHFTVELISFWKSLNFMINRSEVKMDKAHNWLAASFFISLLGPIFGPILTFLPAQGSKH